MKKNEFTIIDIIGISLIFIVLVILVIPLVVKMANNYSGNSTKIKAATLLNSALLEYKNDVSLGREITAYCYRSDYGYPKTLNDGTIRSISNSDNELSYYITFDSDGNITSFVFADINYGMDLRDDISERAIEELSDDEFLKVSEAFEIIEKCPYSSN